VLERVELLIWYRRGETDRKFYLEGFRRRYLQPGDAPPAPYGGGPL
jgi:hypothetical protein